MKSRESDKRAGGSAKQKHPHDEHAEKDYDRVAACDAASKAPRCSLQIYHAATQTFGIVFGEWHPSGFATPARLDELSFKWKARPERGSCPWCAFGFERGGERHHEPTTALVTGRQAVAIVPPCFLLDR